MIIGVYLLLGLFLVMLYRIAVRPVYKCNSKRNKDKTI